MCVQNFLTSLKIVNQQRTTTTKNLHDVSASRARLSAKTEFILIEQLSDVSSEPKFTIGLNERIN